MTILELVYMHLCAGDRAGLCATIVQSGVGGPGIGAYTTR